jgi:glycerol-3-phosphate dehydrogenase (NAD(P)+)
MTKATTFPSIAVLGAGAWGVALANAASRAGHRVALWARDRDHVEEMRATGESRRLPGVKLAGGISFEVNFEKAVAADLILLVVPAQATDAMALGLAAVIVPGVPVVVCSKGIERLTGRFMSDVVAARLPRNPPAVLSGPSFAADVSRGLPTAVTLAAADEHLARQIAATLTSASFRLYHTNDMRGVEIGGAAKNVLAIACGAARGRGLGASAEAALVARGFAELRRFGAAWGGRPETLMGLSGLGDLVLTCGSEQSRNFALGMALGRGEAPDDASHGKLAEGAATAPVLVEMALQRDVDMPISTSVADLLAGKITINQAIHALMTRPSRAEV